MSRFVTKSPLFTWYHVKNMGFLWAKSAKGVGAIHQTIGKQLESDGSRAIVIHTKYAWLTIEIPKRKS